MKIILKLFLTIVKSAQLMPEMVNFVRVFENLQLAVKQRYQTGHF